MKIFSALAILILILSPIACAQRASSTQPLASATSQPATQPSTQPASQPSPEALALSEKQTRAFIPHTAPFLHPGVMHAQWELDFIKNKLAANEEPWKSAFHAMQQSPKAS